MVQGRYKKLKEFWPYYVREHSHPWTRRMHFIGTTNLIIWLCGAILRRNLAFVPIGIISSYMLAWIGHFFIEHNIPATFKYPILSALAELTMYGKMWRGQMDSDVAMYTKEAGSKECD